MVGVTLDNGKTVYTCGQPMTALHLITAGRISVSYPGGQFEIGKGDVVGIVEISSEVHFLEYRTLEETTILTYSLATMESLANLLKKHPDVAKLFLLSAFRQIGILQNRFSFAEMSSSNLFQELNEDYDTYKTLCGRYRITPRNLDSLNDVTSLLPTDTPDLWLNSYYTGLIQLYTNEQNKALTSQADVSLGMLRKCSLDFRRTFSSLLDLTHYQEKVSQFYFQESGNDLFDFFTTLYYRIGPDNEDASTLFTAISRMILEFQNTPSSKQAFIQQRIQSFQKNLDHLHSSESADSADDSSAILSELAGSLSMVLDYAGSDLALADSFRGHIRTYLALPNRNSLDEDVSTLRNLLTDEFYMLYDIIFQQSLENPFLPLPVRMFLYFGYVDEELAGPENAVLLYRLANSISDHGDSGVYTFYDWLLAIYNGTKEPSRNEFEQDYTDYIHKQKLGGTITNQEYLALEKNSLAKVSYELRNMFPSLNRMTYGRATFCPVFCSENVLKDLKDCQVTSAQIGKAIELVRATDYSAFYRGSLDHEHLDLMGKETIHMEYLPDIILMPNIGLRGVLWQEIEGKRRNSPARMAFSIFHLEDVNTSFLRMTGEFRWDLSRRIQGTRWNDISQRSLTSEYYDYIQFYRKNHDLSSEAKERLRVALQRSKNSFREMFVRDYIIWLLAEGNGSPRLNKTARRIFFTYCPFSAPVCERLKSHPLYAELILQKETKARQRLHTLNILRQKLQNGNHPVPDTLLAEIKFTEGDIS